MLWPSRKEWEEHLNDKSRLYFKKKYSLSIQSTDEDPTSTAPLPLQFITSSIFSKCFSGRTLYKHINMKQKLNRFSEIQPLKKRVNHTCAKSSLGGAYLARLDPSVSE